MKTHQEPWLSDKTATAIYVKTADGNLVCIEELYSIHPTKRDYMQSKFSRIVESVNACAGIEDPAAAIQAARDALEMMLDGGLEGPSKQAIDMALAALNLLTPKQTPP